MGSALLKCMRTVNERLIDSLQAILHRNEEFRVNAVAPTRKGRIMVRNGRIRFAEFDGQTGIEALKGMIREPDLKISCLQMNWDTADRDYIDQCDEAIDEFLISYAFELVNNQGELDETQTRAIRSEKMQQTGGLHLYDVFLEARGGPHDGKVFYLNQGTNRIGTGQGNTIQIEQDTVSRRHCTVVLTEHFIKIRDDNSTNGTRVNGAHVTEAYLESEDEVALGEAELVLKLRFKAGHSSPDNRHSKWARKTNRVPEMARETLNWSDFIKEDAPNKRNFTQMIKNVFSEGKD